MNKLRHKKITDIFKIFSITVILNFTLAYSNESVAIKDDAQKAFINGSYSKANKLFYEVYINNKSSFNEKKYALRMKSLLLEQYLGEVDSSIEYNKEYLKNYCTSTRETKITNEKINFLISLGDAKKEYGEYQKIVFTNTDDEIRAKQLKNFNKKYPNFIKRKESLKHCAIAGLNSSEYLISYKAYKQVKKEFPPLSNTEKMQYQMSKRMVIRYRAIQIIILIWILTFFIFIKEILNFFKSDNSDYKDILRTAGLWVIILVSFIAIYTLKIRFSDHNPFRIGDMFLMSIMFTFSILLNSFVIVNRNSFNYKFFVSILTTLTILGTSYFTTYNRPERITVMDDLYDQVGDIILKDKNGQKGKNTQN